MLSVLLWIFVSGLSTYGEAAGFVPVEDSPLCEEVWVRVLECQSGAFGTAFVAG